VGLLLIGLVVWSAAHLLKSAGIPIRARLIAAVGFDPYRGLFSLVILASVAMMIFGWRSATPSVLYTPPAWSVVATDVLMFAALLLFAASALPTNIKRVLRHPQLTGLVVWSAAHLLANGDSRSLLLFGGLGSWALVSMLAINRRDGAWQKPAALPISAELKPFAAAVALYVLLFSVHPWIAGVSPMPH